MALEAINTPLGILAYAPMCVRVKMGLLRCLKSKIPTGCCIGTAIVVKSLGVDVQPGVFKN